MNSLVEAIVEMWTEGLVCVKKQPKKKKKTNDHRVYKKL